MLKKKKKMEHLAICVITLTTQEFSAYKKHDTAQAGPGGTPSNSYVIGIFLPVAGTMLSRPDVPTQLTQRAVDAGGFLNSAHQSRPDRTPGPAALCIAIYISFLSTFYCRKDSDILKITKNRKTCPCIHCPPSSIVRHEPCPSQSLTASLLLCVRQQLSHFYLNHS